ncbi:hypothetical protein NEISUBOT_03188 [Neisseria subflava NJ9703]|uniref:Uncharacterized protein n=1 Tax=Neisseria subflava NJ9703 TaxID=546268 RepID=A0A9W5ISY7_NEISU|nr:hypothetical protein NEISUBOT_03188 [Neisseria subflava NJ9703]
MFCCITISTENENSFSDYAQAKSVIRKQKSSLYTRQLTASSCQSVFIKISSLHKTYYNAIF